MREPTARIYRITRRCGSWVRRPAGMMNPCEPAACRVRARPRSLAYTLRVYKYNNNDNNNNYTTTFPFKRITRQAFAGAQYVHDRARALARLSRSIGWVPRARVCLWATRRRCYGIGIVGTRAGTVTYGVCTTRLAPRSLVPLAPLTPCKDTSLFLCSRHTGIPSRCTLRFTFRTRTLCAL